MMWPFKTWRKGGCVARCAYCMATWILDYGERSRAVVKRIVETPERIEDHIQAQGWDSKKGEWRYLVMLRDGVVDYGDDEFPGYPVVKTLTPVEFLRERLNAEIEKG